MSKDDDVRVCFRQAFGNILLSAKVSTIPTPQLYAHLGLVSDCLAKKGWQYQAPADIPDETFMALRDTIIDATTPTQKNRPRSSKKRKLSKIKKPGKRKA
jgi:hypothetical protein